MERFMVVLHLFVKSFINSHVKYALRIFTIFGII